MRKKKIIICAIQWRSGGSLVLHYLCKELRLRGYDARIFYMPRGYYEDKHRVIFWLRWIKDNLVMSYNLLFNIKPNLLLKEDFEGCKRQWTPLCRKDLVIYNENIYGNPLKCKSVVRWLLNEFPFENDLSAYGENDLILAYREIFNDYRLNPNCNLFTLNSYNWNIYKQINFGEREGICYVIRKGKNRNDLPIKFEGPIIDDLDEKEKVKELNKKKYCILYDPQTAYANIAAVCGCIPIVIPEPGKTKSDYRSKNDITYGIAFSWDEIEWALETRPLLLAHFRKKEAMNQHNLELFLKKCKEKFEDF